MEEIQVLPDEVLGWLLLRRANLSAASRLSVQASVNNSLKFQDIETALRDQEEEELLQADQHRGGHQGKRRTFWVEEEGQWGLLASNGDDVDEQAEIHWVGSQLAPEVYDPGPGALQDPYDDDEIFWNCELDGWHGYVQDGQGFWLETDGFGTYWNSDDGYADLPPEEAKELDDAYMAYENKARTFLQSRQLQRAKGASRGFYPLGMMKGKGGKSKDKGKKGKSFGKPGPSTSTPPPPKPLFAAQGMDGAASSAISNTGCFICGDKSHGFRFCPKRSASSSAGFGKGAKKSFWVESLTASSLAFIGMVASSDEVIYDTSGYGVLDLGATETVGSLEALEALMEIRINLHGNQEPVEVFIQDPQPESLSGSGMVVFSFPPAMLWCLSVLVIGWWRRRGEGTHLDRDEDVGEDGCSD